GALHRAVPLQLDAAVLSARRRARAELGRNRPVDLQPELHGGGFRRSDKTLPGCGGENASGRLVVAPGLPLQQEDPPADTERDADATSALIQYPSPSWPGVAVRRTASFPLAYARP